MGRKLISLILLAMTFAPSATSAQMVNSRFAWDELSPDQKQGYTLGVLDQLIIHWEWERPEDKARVDGQVSCLNRLRLSSSDLVKLIDETYKNAANSSLSAQFVLFDRLGRVCLNEINVERTKAGLRPYTDHTPQFPAGVSIVHEPQ